MPRKSKERVALEKRLETAREELRELNHEKTVVEATIRNKEKEIEMISEILGDTNE
jgi:hypothetical protein